MPATFVCVCVCMCVCVCGLGYQCMVLGCFCFLFVFFKLHIWMFQHACLDTCCFECLIIKLYACVLYLPMFSAVEHVSHGKVL